MESPLLQLLLTGLIGYVFYLWLSDFKTFKKGHPRPGALPGSVPSSSGIIYTGVAGALLLVALETLGENRLGISKEQSEMTLLFAAVTLASGFGEELVFRGYLVIQNKGRKILWASIFGFSVLFTVIHPYLWSWEINHLELQFTTKAWFSTSVVFVNSVWFYWLRFCKWNPSQSLWPSIAAHCASNAAVFLVKLAQGHVSSVF